MGFTGLTIQIQIRLQNMQYSISSAISTHNIKNSLRCYAKGKTLVIKKPAKFKGYNNEFTTSTRRAQIQCNNTSLSSGSNSLDTQQKKLQTIKITYKIMYCYIPLMRSSWACMSASTNWCFLIRFCTDARSLPESSDVRRDSTSPSQKSKSLTAAMYVRCLFASFSFTVFSVVFWVRYSHWSAMDARRAYNI